MRCPACEGETPDGKRFCQHCGEPLAAVCAVCGAHLGAGRFCADCGSPVAGRDTAPPAGADRSDEPASGSGFNPVAERRLCSILFVDLVGFTPLAEKRDAEEIRELLSLYFERAQAIVGHYGGTVEKFIGDAVMAVWGAPVANEDDAERAVRAGLEIVASVAELGVEAGIDGLSARGGVVTGEAAITIGKVAEGMVLGDTVNSASRVQSAAPPGAVLVDESTWRAASGAISFVEFGALTLKGKEDPVQAWRALRVVAQRKGVGRSDRIEPPFVGRDEELRLIRDLLHATEREQRARLVSVTGIPGIGKSRLAWEFLKYVDGLVDTVYWHQGRSPAYGEGVTFWALGEMVRMRARINESEAATSSRSKLSSAVAEFVPDAEERRWVEPRLAHLLGLAEAPAGDREELFSAWRTFFERIAAVGPIVMVFEDLQWADPGLIDFIESILEWSRNHPIMVVTLSRPELMDRRPTWGAGQRSFTSLHLEPLSRESMRALLDGFVQGLPDEVATRVLERAEGVPLYAVEMVRMLVDRDVLLQHEGTYSVTGELGSLEIPETLQALIASRLDALPSDQRALLQDAAILGTTFTTRALAVLQVTEPSRLEADLRDLVRKEFLSVDTDPRSPDRGQYGFVQGVIGEVAVATLSRRDRSAKHLAVARHFESLEDEELAGLVAAHYVEAYRAAPDGPEAADVGAAARGWLSRAGQRALSLGSPEQALSFFEQALDVTGAGAGRAALLELAGDAGDRVADHARAVPFMEEAVAYYTEVGDVSATGRATAKLAGVLGPVNRQSEGIALCERALAAVGEGGDPRVRAELASQLSDDLTGVGRPEEALGWAETALIGAERLDDTELLGRAVAGRSTALFNLGRHREALMLARGLAVLAAETGSLREEAMAWIGVSVFALPDDPRESLAAAIRSVELSRRAGIRGLELTNLLNSAETSAYLGLWDDTRSAVAELGQRELRGAHVYWLSCVEALLAALTGDAPGASALIDRHGEQLESAEYVNLRTTYLNARAMVSLAGGDLDTARRSAADAVAADPMGINSAISLTLQARASLWLRDAEGAREALTTMRRVRGRLMAAARLTVEAGLAALDGDADGAGGLYRQSIEAWRVLDCTLDLALTELDLIMLLGPDHPDATVGKEARDIFVELGATPFLNRLNEASGR